MNSWILLNDPTPPMSDESAIINEPSGSASNVKRESDVNTVAVSSVLPSLLFEATMENTAKARIGEAICEM
jgi:hypothetical protein